MASGGYEVTPSELDKAAEVYKAQGEAVGQALAQFKQAADLHGSAFGNLPQSRQMAAQYQKLYDEVTKDMAKLSGALLAGYATLVISAANYRTAEHASTIR